MCTEKRGKFDQDDRHVARQPRVQALGTDYLEAPASVCFRPFSAGLFFTAKAEFRTSVSLLAAGNDTDVEQENRQLPISYQGLPAHWSPPSLWPSPRLHRFHTQSFGAGVLKDGGSVAVKQGRKTSHHPWTHLAIVWWAILRVFEGQVSCLQHKDSRSML